MASAKAKQPPFGGEETASESTDSEETESTESTEEEMPVPAKKDKTNPFAKWAAAKAKG